VNHLTKEKGLDEGIQPKKFLSSVGTRRWRELVSGNYIHLRITVRHLVTGTWSVEILLST
jgi:hypothetical protein